MIPPFQPPQSPALSIPFMESLEVELELVRLDIPLCVLLRDSIGRRYLGHTCGYSSTGTEYWFIVPIGEDALPRLLSGQLALLSALLATPDQHRLVGAITRRTEDGFQFGGFYPCPAIDSLKQYLPNSSFKFFEEEFIGHLGVTLAPITPYARKCMAEVFYLRLLGPRMRPSLLPLAYLADIGKALQRLLTNLAMFKTEPLNFGRRGYVSHSIEHASQFALTAIMPGSVQLRLESVQNMALIGEYDVAHNAAAALTQLTGPTDVGQICHTLSNFPPRIKSSYLSYLTSLSKADAGIELQWGSPNQAAAWESEWNAELVSEIVDQVSQLAISKETVFEATGFFIAGSLHTGRLDFLDTETNRSINGRLAPDFQQEIVSLSRGAQKAVLYNVSVREVISSTPDNTTKYEYTFLDVQEIGMRRKKKSPDLL